MTGYYVSIVTQQFKGFCPYSEDIGAALALLRRLAEFPVPATPNDQKFADELMASALRYTAEGMRKFGIGAGVRQDRTGIAICATQVDYLADRTTAPVACEFAAAEIAKLSGTSAPLAIINAAADALKGAC